MKIFGFGSSKPAANPSNDAANEANPIADEASVIVGEANPIVDEANVIVSEANVIVETPNLVVDEANDVANEPNIVADEASDIAGEASVAEPPRALFPGSFLGGELEIVEVLSRGPVNYYCADADDYGAHDFKLVAQRRAPQNPVFDAPETPFFPAARRFAEDDHEYAVWDFAVLKPLEDWSAAPNDETYLSVMGAVARGFLALENAGLRADLPVATLFFEGDGALRSYGFFDVAGAGLAPSSNREISSEVELTRLEEGASPAPDGIAAVPQLSALSSRFAKTNLAARATLRLDDEFGALPFSDEVKGFARALNNGDFAAANAVVAALEAFQAPTRTETALQTDVGMERELNEDCGLIWKSSRAGHARHFEIELLAVADGMGGHEGGEVASDVALSALETAISRRRNLNFADNGAVLSAMHEILSEVNDAVIRLTENPPYASMRAKPGATLVCALRVGSRVFIGNVGDSRAYKWHENGGLERLTRDHSYVQDLLDSGSITEDEAWGHPDGSVITSHIGLLRGFKKDVFLRLLNAGDRLVLVSDGVVDTLRDPQIEIIIAANGNGETLCAALVDAANEAGGFDNITVAVLICS